MYTKTYVKYYTYAIRSLKRKYIYVGITDNPERRIIQHNQGRSKTTKPYEPFELILLEEYNSKKEAREREKYLKSGCGKEYLKTIRQVIKPEWWNW